MTRFQKRSSPLLLAIYSNEQRMHKQSTLSMPGLASRLSFADKQAFCQGTIHRSPERVFPVL